MMDNSEDYDFTPSASSNLRSLFDNASSFDSSSLMYTAPKQPKPIITTETKPETTKAETSVVCTQIVQVWKLNDGQYISTGKHGFAIIGSVIQPSFEIILYKDKRNVVGRAKLDPSFVFTLRKDDFASFYDASQENWLIKFNNQEECQSVINHIEKYGGKVIPVVDNVPKDNNPTENKNVNESSDTEHKARADILSRIAKMGQSILPNKTADAEQEISEAAETASISSSSGQSEHSTNITFATSTSALTPSTVVQHPMPVQNLPNTLIMSQAMPYDPLNLYVAETRAQNSEIRMNLSQISEKINHITQLFDISKINSGPDSHLRDTLKSKVKVSELRIENLQKELAFVQNENVTLKQKIAHQYDILRNEQQTKVELKLAQEEESVKIAALQKEINECKNKNTELVKQIETQNNEMDELKKQIESLQEGIKEKNDTTRLENIVLELEQKLKECEERNVQDTTKNVSDEEIKQKSANFTSMLKEEMNGMYANIVGNFNNDQLDLSDVNSVIAQNIKNTTLKIIQNFQKLYENE